MTTARLQVRPVAEADRDRFVELFTDPSFMVYSERGALDLDAARRRFERMVTLVEELPFAKQALVEKTSGSIIGYVGVDHFALYGERRLEFGYRLVAEARGRGYATEAGRALLDVAAETWHGELVAFIDPANHASRNVLRKLGFTFVEHISIFGDDAELYSITL